MRLPFRLSQTVTKSLLLLSVISGFVVFTSCQTAGPSEPDSVKRTYRFKDTTDVDTVKWKTDKDSGLALLEPKVDSVRPLSITTSSPLKPGVSVTLSLYTLGIRTTIVPMVTDGKSGLAISTQQPVVYDSLARRLITKLKQRRKTADSSLFPLTREGLVQLYARELIDGNDPTLLGFPKVRPVGVDSSAVIDAALLYQVPKKLPFTKFQFLLADSAKAHDRILALLREKKLVSADSIILFPLPPVHVKESIKLASDSLVPGGGKVNLMGIFAADPEVGIVSINVSIKDSGNTDRTAEWFIVNQPSSPSGALTWDLANKLSIRAEASAKPGLFKLLIHAIGKNGKDTASVTLIFRVLPLPPEPDRKGPEVRYLDPDAATKTVANEVSTYDVRVGASDVSGVDSVYIDGQAAVLADGKWGRTVPLPVVGAPTEVKILAKDKLGNETKAAIYITRQAPAGAVGPKIDFKGASANLEIPFSQKTVKLAWVIKDPVKFVTLNGAALAPINDTLFEAEVTVPATGVVVEYRLLAISKELLGSEHLVKIARAKDDEAPSVVPDTASWTKNGVFQGDTLVIPTSTTSLTLGWKVLDNHQVKSVTLDGDELKPNADGMYEWKISSLAAGITKATVVAVDSMGNTKLVYAKLLRRDQVRLNFSVDTVFWDAGTFKASSSTPNAIVEYSTDGNSWKLVPEEGIKLTGSATLIFRGRADGFAETVVTRGITIKVTPPPEAKGAVWNEFNWDDKLRYWQ